MSDIFTIKGINAVLKVGESEYKFADPCFPEKVKLQKEMRELAGKELSAEDRALEMFEINKKMIKLYLPDIEPKVLNKMGDFSMLALIDKLTELSGTHFGAVVEKVDSKKKD